MSFGIGLSAGLKALAAARMGIETAGQNVANANTPGYSRQQVMQVAAFPFVTGNGLQVGTGVQVDDIRRIVDDGLLRRIRTQIGFFGGSQVDYNRLSELENAFHEPEGGLSADFTGLFGQIQQLQTSPADTSMRGGMIQSGNALATGLNQLARRLQEIEGSAFHEIEAHLQRVNQLAGSIAQINTQIAALEANSSTSNDLRDTRERHVKEISELMDVQVLERSNGMIDVQVSGFLLVSATRTAQLSALKNAKGQTDVILSSSAAPVRIHSGMVAALQRHEQTEIPRLLEKLDRLAKNMAFEFNRIHSTGIPAAGNFRSLESSNLVADTNGNGVFGDELLAESGLPFEVQNGELHVSITDKSTGDVRRSRIAIDPTAMSLLDVASALDSVEHLNASVDAMGRLRISADAGYGFDFSPRLDPFPDSFQTFGSGHAVAGSSGSGPYDLSLPASLQVTIDGNSHTVNFNSGQFQNPSKASAEEVAAAMNADAGFAADGLAVVIGGRLVIRSHAEGSSAQLSVAAGATQAALGLPSGTHGGQDNGGLQIEVRGLYTGSGNGQFVFIPDQDGTLGLTDPLTIGVFDQDGKRIATIDAGPNGAVNEEFVEVQDGILVRIQGTGDLRASSGEVFAVDTLVDSDTSDFLAATGINAYFQGSTAADLRVHPNLIKDPSLLAVSLSGDSGDAGNLERLLALRDRSIAGLDGGSLEGFYSRVVGDLGFQVAGAETVLQAEDQLNQALEEQRQSISGVNLDEEMVNLVAYQQAFQAASRFINVVNEITTTLINLGA